MKWTRTSPTSLESGPFAIGTFYLDGATLYLLTIKRGNDVEKIKYDEDPEALMKIADSMGNKK